MLQSIDLFVRTNFNLTMYLQSYRRLSETCFTLEINGRPFVKQPALVFAVGHCEFNGQERNRDLQTK